MDKEKKIFRILFPHAKPEPNDMVDQILALFELPKDKPPLLSDNPYPNAHKNHKSDRGCFQCGVHLGYEEGKKAQRESDIKHYGGGK